MNWNELNWIEFNWIELNLFDWTGWLQLSIFKPKRPSIEWWCMLFYACVTRDWCEKIFIFFSILECVGSGGSERFCDLVGHIGYTRREPPHQGLHWPLTKSAGKDYTAFFPASAWNPRVLGSGHSWPDLSVKGAKQKFLYVIRKGHGKFSISMLENMLSHVYKYNISFWRFWWNTGPLVSFWNVLKKPDKVEFVRFFFFRQAGGW